MRYGLEQEGRPAPQMSQVQVDLHGIFDLRSLAFDPARLGRVPLRGGGGGQQEPVFTHM